MYTEVNSVIKHFVFIFLSVFSPYGHNQETDGNEGYEPLFVSLGARCEVAHILRSCEMRKEAFPFDWIVSMDLEQIVTMLQDDFKYFLDENHLSVHGVIGDVPLLNTYYRLEFLHEGNWKRLQYASTMAEFKSKYARRIQRFRDLAKYRGKVYFIREVYPGASNDPHRIYRYAESEEIDKAHAESLYFALKSYFRDLNFSLVILNYGDGGDIEEEVRLVDDLIMVRVNRSLDFSVKKEVFKNFLTNLTTEESRF